MIYPGIKRAMDFIFAFIAIVILAPIFVLFGLIILIQDGGNPIFRQMRVGRKGEPFAFYKFRSMPLNTANVVSTDRSKLKITPFGKFIRRTNFDELPQFFNILKGDMSLIGPRPPIESQVELVVLRKKNGSISMRPGMTGWAQVNAYDHMPLKEKADFDGYYGKHLSFQLDMLIIWKTAIYFTKKPPVY